MSFYSSSDYASGKSHQLLENDMEKIPLKLEEIGFVLSAGGRQKLLALALEKKE